MESIGDKKGQSWALGNLGNALTQDNKFDEAIVYLKENRKLAEQIKLRSDLAESDRRLSQAYLGIGQIQSAYHHAILALDESKAIGRLAFVGLTFRLLGNISVRARSTKSCILPDIEEPEKYYEKSFKIAIETGNESEKRESLLAWGKYLIMSRDTNDHGKGQELIKRAQRIIINQERKEQLFQTDRDVD